MAADQDPAEDQRRERRRRSSQRRIGKVSKPVQRIRRPRRRSRRPRSALLDSRRSVSEYQGRNRIATISRTDAIAPMITRPRVQPREVHRPRAYPTRMAARAADRPPTEPDRPLGTDPAAAGDAASRRTRSTSAAPRPPATPTSGAARPTGPTGSPRWRSPRPGPTRPARHRRRRRLPARPGAARPAGRGARRRQRRALRARHRRLARTGSSRAGTGSRSSARSQGRRDGRLPARRARRGAHAERVQARGAPAAPIPIILAALRGKMLRLAVEKADGAFTNFLPLSGLPQVVERARRRARRLRAPLPLLLPPGRARAGRAARALHVRLLHHRARLRRVLPLARPRRGDRRDGRGLGAKDREARPRRRPGS